MQAASTFAMLFFACPLHAEKLQVKIGYIHAPPAVPPTLSNLDTPSLSQGYDGVMLAVSENNTTGKFLNQSYEIIRFDTPNADVAGIDYLILNMARSDMLAFANKPENANKILFNVNLNDADLRDKNCARNMFHTLPSVAMLTDALAQFGLKKKWVKWALITGPKSQDREMGAALKKSAEKFGIKIVSQKDWHFDSDMRRNAAREVPLFTQTFKKHDLVVVADPTNDFARYVQYNTWTPRPIAGGAGIKPTAWSRSVEQYGAVQLQNRFREMASRQMAPIDYAAWAAVRSIGESVTRTKSANPNDIRTYMLSDDFALAGFKGRSLSYRNWNGQLRQPIALAHHDAVVAMAPIDGFLHQYNELDTLGRDKSESKCRAFEKE
jgi:ABC transporter substrate binding protein (PQQ-dependent alcohol dehydrogenase system)